MKENESQPQNKLTEEIQLLTVGTGTAGASSFVSSGIAAAILHDRPTAAFLAPSSDPASVAVAELVSEECRKTGCDVVRPPPTCEDFRFRNPDDIDGCHEDASRFLDVLRSAYPDARLIVNPTSGTKQMTAAATIAALDMGIDELRFITGPRQDGVVMTGQESVTRFYTRSFMAMRSRKTVLDLMNAGAYAQAADLAADHLPELADIHRQARLYKVWNRLDYRSAMMVAQESNDSVSRHARRVLGRLVCHNTVSIERVADLAAAALRSAKMHLPEEGVARMYRMLEALGKFRLAHAHHTSEGENGYNLDDMCRLLPPQRSGELRRQSRNGNTVWLGLRQLYDILDTLGDALADDMNRCQAARDLMAMRNNSIYGHGDQPVRADRLMIRFEQIIERIGDHYPDFRERVRESEFFTPAVETQHQRTENSVPLK